MQRPNISDIRREYGNLSLNEKDLPDDPLEQFDAWFQEALNNAVYDPTAMVLSTVDDHGSPDSRVVLLKAIEAAHFIFYSNYKSAKGKQLAKNHHAALNFYWPEMARQVRIRGLISLINHATSDSYFRTRPKLSQISAMASAQSQPIANRQVLEAACKALTQQYAHQLPPRPKNWGGYALLPHSIEFWQGRDNRLHDRIHYHKAANTWQKQRLAP